ncbi:tetratricopeptide repeat protein [Prolixibacteraceae bacterium JC049]|nr:tetratricopeptide repeat protein [Prolixibacteraceae bacterium JC049]
MLKKLIPLILLSVSYITVFAKHSIEEIDRMINTGVIEFFQTKNSNNASLTFKKALKFSSEINDTPLIVKSLNNLGMISIYDKKYKNGLNYYQQALDLISEKNSNPRFIALLGIGQAKSRLGDYAGAFNHFSMVAESALMYDREITICSCYNEMGIIKKTQKRYGDALHYFKKYFEIKKKQHNTKGVARAYNNIGDTYKEMEQLDSAMVYYRKSLALKNKIGNKRLIASTLHNMAEVQFRLGQVNEAKQNLKEVLATREKMGDSQGVVSSLLVLAQIAVAQNNYTKAEQLLSRAEKIALQINHLALKKRLYEQQKEVYAQQGKLKLALAYYKKFSQVKDSVFNIEASKNIQRLEVVHETKQKEQQIKLLNVENENKAQENRYMRLALVAVFIVFVALVIISRQFQRSKLLKERISGQNQESTRLARELHDSVSGDLTVLWRQMEKEYPNEPIVDELSKVAEKVRGVSHQLNVQVIAKQEFRAALADSLRLKFWPEGVDLQIHVPKNFRIDDYHKKVNLIRIAQELTTNSLKHSEATRIELTFEQRQKKIFMMYIDNGVGMDRDVVAKGNGWANIEARVSFLLGKMVLKTAKGEGFHFELTV